MATVHSNTSSARVKYMGRHHKSWD